MDPLDRLIRGAADELNATVASAYVTRQRAQVERIYRKLHARRALRRWWAVPVALAAMLALLWVVRPSPRDVELSATLESRPFAAGSSLHAGEEPRVLRFSDRSQVALAPGSEARLTQSDGERVRVELARGRLDIRVRPGGRHTWIVAAGPYTVEVTGTVFAVTWERPTPGLTVEVAAGRVHVRGATLGVDGVVLRAGQQLHVQAAEVASAPEPAAAAMPACAGSDCAGPPGVPTAGRLPSRAAVHWRELAGQGEHAKAIAAAERAGLEVLLERLTAADLDRLVWSARLAGAAGPARDGLLTLRRRFPAHARAHLAAFLLGRVALELAGDTSTAARWFETYLHEQPSGALAEQARGRLMEIRHERGERAQAEAMAREYLQHHPRGERAPQARRILLASD